MASLGWLLNLGFAAGETTAVAEDATKGGGARSLQEMRRLERQQLLEMLRQDDEMILPILLQLIRRR